MSSANNNAWLGWFWTSETEEEHGGQSVLSSSRSKRTTSETVNTEVSDTISSFDDGVRRVDYVIVFKKDEDLEAHRRFWRNNFIDGLNQQGLQVEETAGQSKKCKDYSFIKVHAPWDTLANFAETMAIRKPLLPAEVAQKSNWLNSWFSSAKSLPEEDAVKKAHSEDSYRHWVPFAMKTVTSPFSYARQTQFLIEDKDTFFSPAERSMVVHYILSRTVFGRTSNKGDPRFGINELKKQGAIIAAYPMHSSQLHRSSIFNVNNLFYGTWEYFGGNLFAKREGSAQLSHVRYYFGEKIAFFFCWMCFYTNMLIPIAMIAFCVLLYGLITSESDEFFDDICDTSGHGNITVCKTATTCSDCNSLQLCPRTTVADVYCYDADLIDLNHVFTNKATVMFAVCVTIWSFVFLKLWLRRSSVLQTEWHVRDYKKEELLRPQFYTLKGERRPHPITDELEPFITLKEKYARRFCSMTMIVLIVGVVTCKTFVTSYFLDFLKCQSFATEFVQLFINTTLTNLLSLVFLVVFTKMYVWLCTILTDFEMHRTESDWTDNFRLKYFLFCFTNYNAAPLSYVIRNIAARKSLAFTKSGNDMSLLLLFYMLGKPILLFVIDRLQATITHTWQKFRSATASNDKSNMSATDAEADLTLKKPVTGHSFTEHLSELMTTVTHYNNFDSRHTRQKGRSAATPKDTSDMPAIEADFTLKRVPRHVLTEQFSELMIQYGFVTMYAAVFPLASLCAVVKNVLILRYISNKFSNEWRRPVAERDQDIGIYNQIMSFITYISVTVNAVIIASQTQFVSFVVHESYEKATATYSEFIMREHDDGNNGTCRADYTQSMVGEIDTCESTCWSCRHDRMALVVAMSFIACMVVFSKCIQLVSDINEADNNALLRESYLAQKVIRQYLMRGSATVKDMQENSTHKKKSLFEGTLEEPSAPPTGELEEVKDVVVTTSITDLTAASPELPNV